MRVAVEVRERHHGTRGAERRDADGRLERSVAHADAQCRLGHRQGDGRVAQDHVDGAILVHVADEQGNRIGTAVRDQRRLEHELRHSRRARQEAADHGDAQGRAWHGGFSRRWWQGAWQKPW
jgi:hypothetical protein